MRPAKGKSIRRSIYKKRTASSSKRQSVLKAIYLAKDVQCLQCRLTFPDYMGCCPQCGSEERTGLAEVNPYTRMPMSSFLKACGHVFWLVGVAAFLILIWQTDNINIEKGLMFFYAGLFSIVCGVILSAAYFALSELLRRVLRIQRRLQAFHETYRSSQPLTHKYVQPFPPPLKKHIKNSLN